MNNLIIKMIKDRDAYKYFGIDENISHVETVNKEKKSNEIIFNQGEENLAIRTFMFQKSYCP